MNTNKEIPIYEYAKMKGVQRQTVYRWIREGKLKNYKVIEKIVQRIVIVE
jgi:excisionase family DNA binding protein